MNGGYTGKILRVNLDDGKITIEEWDQALAREFIGGVGLAAKIIWDETNAATDPFSGENPLVLMAGPVTGTRVPTSGRWSAAALSPLTNIWGEAHAGGTFGHAMKFAGLDGIVVKGKAQKPVYLWIDGERVELRDASHLWGKDTWQTDELVKAETDPRASVSCIGPAGEKLVRFAVILNDGKMGRVHGRCGLGAVMGSKKLKAIAVKGVKRPAVADEEGLKNSVTAKFVRRHLEFETELKPRWTESSGRLWREGKRGVKNYQTGPAGFPQFHAKYFENLMLGEKLYCAGCSVGCIESKTVGDKRHQVAQHTSCSGARLMIDDFEALQESFDMSNRYGLEIMSLGGVIAFAMECYDRGLITRKDTDGIDLKWGNPEAMLAITRQIGEREGFGRLLGEGVKRAAEQIGGLAPEYAIHVKGHEFPSYDVRAWNAGALEFATASSGAHHYEATTFALSLVGDFFASILGEGDLGSIAKNRFAVKGVGKLTAKAQDFGCVVDSLVTCKMLIGYTFTGQAVQPDLLLEWTNLVTGWNMDMREFIEAGERIFNLKRMINVRRGISRKDDTLPARFLTARLGSGEGGTADNLPPLGAMLNEYYEHRGWAEDGIPTKAKLLDLGLGETVEWGR
ncbi:MAG: aldehyde ferredoxin oxidoreductase family protein [Chloroflexi bacterium]|nr:aldehyde ferredoxin oxidoreductase family protein [Chloroflexota bacterium]